ncbi:hypothetical protein AQUCO_03800169v1 [Aquilegia coerulea]|uniref:Ubiquitin-like domain-containing protein n=1 Tax=Aquilegia coerulea TaxID=218851 RepID=A0A2G5CSW4_AQUCA|nr:hypothetical protein AQUCO_03800169v1 [Aquilegia coerulea]
MSNRKRFSNQLSTEHSLVTVEDQMKIQFRIMKTIPLEVKKCDTVRKVRSEFSEIEGVSKVNLKKLFFEGNCLEDEKKLIDYGIQNGSTINMFLDSGVRVQIHVKMSQIGKTVTLDVDIRDTVHTVKGKIQNKEGLTTSQLDLLYLGEHLDNRQFLATYKIEDGATLYAFYRVGDAMQINVSLEQGNRTINLKVKSWYSIENVKNIIESMEGIPTKKQKLYLTGVKLENDMTLADSKILQGQTLDLICGMHIFVKMLTGKIYTLEVDSYDSVDDVKEMMEEKEGIPTEQQRLIYRGRQIESGRFLADYQVEEDSVLHLVLCLCGC